MSQLRLLSLLVQDFRNLLQVSLTPSAKANLVVGQNGQGKTNLLEAIYFLCTLKPLRAVKLSELVRFGQTTTRVTARFALHGAEREIGIVIQEGDRQALVDGKKAESLEAYFGGVSVVAFTPDDLEVVKGGPAMRRWFLDRAVFNRFPSFLKESRSYARALKARNRLLKERASGPYLHAYDQTLATAGARIWARRQALLTELGPKASQAFASISRGALRAVFDYAPAGVTPPNSMDERQLAATLLEALSSRASYDLERGFTSVGPHADELLIRLDERSARAFASQGQQRALVLAWKVAEIENLRTAQGVLPLLLLDDVSSELDPERNAYLMDYLAQSGAQVFLTTTDPSLVKAAAMDESHWYGVKSGCISPLPRPVQSVP